MRNVIVTGGTRGLGLATAIRLAAEHRVVAVARRDSEALAQARDAEPNLLFRACDLSETADITTFLRGVTEEIGPVYGLVNNAGIGTSGILATQSDADIEALVRLNVLSPILLTKAAVRSMMVGGGGRIVNISSIVATTGYSGISVYSATKSAFTGFTRSLAREVGRLGITVNNVAPGFVDTEMTHEITEGQLARIVSRSALRRLAEAADVAAAVAFLLGEGGRNITGTTITVDAGGTA